MWNEKKEWPLLVEMASIGGKFSAKEIKSLNRSIAGKLLCAIAYYSGCKNPDRVAVLHLITLVAAARCRKITNHRVKESLRERLAPFLNFPGGNKEVVKAGALLLELLSLEDHKADFIEDIINNKENPLSSIDYKSEKERILGEYDNTGQWIKDYFEDFYKWIKETPMAFWL
jgi:hypothetical protein